MKSKIWKVLGEQEPRANLLRRLQFVKAFERLLLTATAGAFFFALARNFPVHVEEFSWQPDWDYTFDRVLRYLCLTWFLAYFFVSSVSNDQSDEPREWRDIGFDSVQSIAVLTAAYFWGFILPDHGFGFNNGLRAFLVSDIVVLTICVLSLCLFYDRCDTGLTRLRWAGRFLPQYRRSSRGARHGVPPFWHCCSFFKRFCGSFGGCSSVFA